MVGEMVHFVILLPPAPGLRFHKCDWSAHGECEAVLHDGTVWTRQPEAFVWHGCQPACGLFHPFLPLVKDKDMNQWEPKILGSSPPGIWTS